jgi:peroxiredoxin Q/BCP
VVLGASFDQPAQNKLFAAAHDLPFRLVSDVDRHVGEVYEVLRNPANPREGGARRITYLIDPRGMIRRSFEVGDIDAHPEEALAALRDLDAGSGGGA